MKANAGLDDRHQRVFNTVNIYARAIEEALTSEDAKPDVWFVIIPDYVKRYCSPQGIVALEDRIQAIRHFKSARQAKVAYNEPFLFDALNEAAQPYLYKEHFRNQLKARLLKHKIATQILREGTLENLGHLGDHARDVARRKLQSQIVWNIATAVFYKADGRPWKVPWYTRRGCVTSVSFSKRTTGARPRNRRPAGHKCSWTPATDLSLRARRAEVV